jgi:hypothetical protein
MEAILSENNTLRSPRHVSFTSILILSSHFPSSSAITINFLLNVLADEHGFYSEPCVLINIRTLSYMESAELVSLATEEFPFYGILSVSMCVMSNKNLIHEPGS